MFARALMMAMLGAGAAAAADEPALNTLKDIAVEPSPSGVRVTVQASQAPVFSVFRLNDPDRLVVDVSGASAGALSGTREGLGPVSGMILSNFSEGPSTVARLLFALKQAGEYDVRAEGEKLVISIQRGAASAPKPAAAAPAEPLPSGVVATQLDEKAVQHPARKVKSVSYAGGLLKVVADGEVGTFELMQLESPPRLAVDLHGVQGPYKSLRGDGLVREVRVGNHAGRVRVVLESAGARLPQFRAQRRADGLWVRLARAPAEAPAQAEAEAEAVIDGQKVALKSSRQVAEVKSVDFRESPSGGEVVVKLSGAVDHAAEQPDPRSGVLTLEGARLPKGLERSFDTSDLETPVKMVSAFAVPGDVPRVRVVASADVALEQKVEERGTELRWTLTRKAPATEEVTARSNVAGVRVEAQTFGEEGAPQQRRSGYRGKRVSFEFKDIDVHNLLRVIAEVSKRNVIVADNVSGKVTIRLRNVPWDEALDLVMRAKSLGKEEFGDILRIAPLGTLKAEAEARREARDAAMRAEPVFLTLLPVNYSKAGDMESRVKDVLSPRGQVTVDLRTNTLLIREIKGNMPRIRSLVAALDIPTPQVLIESRIVEATTRFERQVGIQWGGNLNFSDATGNPTGLVFPREVGARGGIVGGVAQGTADVPSYAVSLPAGALNGRGGAVGLTFGSAGSFAQLNLRLSALESQGVAKTISAPRVTTLDNIIARISQGFSVPYSVVSAAGVQVVFAEARLQLEVTPHITQDGSVLMQIRAENSRPGSGSPPPIERKQAETTVLVKDGETTVIGGIYVRSSSSNQEGLPILSKIPIIGFFFRSIAEQDSRTELMFFISPRILNRQSVAATL